VPVKLKLKSVSANMGVQDSDARARLQASMADFFMYVVLPG
jgi:hypothetical protein